MAEHMHVNVQRVLLLAILLHPVDSVRDEEIDVKSLHAIAIFPGGRLKKSWDQDVMKHNNSSATLPQALSLGEVSEPVVTTKAPGSSREGCPSSWKPSCEVADSMECNDAKDLLKNMVDDERWWEIVMTFAFSIAVFFFLIFFGIFLGTRVKPRPPRYWQNRPFSPFDDDFRAEVDVTEEFREPVQQLFNMTTQKDFMGKGRDGAWATHKGFKVIKVTRIESGRLWSKYAGYKRHMRRVEDSLSKMQPAWRDYTRGAIQNINKVHADREANSTVQSFIKSLGLDDALNERIMFHGSPAAGARSGTGEVLFPSEKACPAYAIKQGGFDDRLGSVKGMYGSGTYFADMVSKADQYAGRYNMPNPQGSIGERATMFLARVALGCPYQTDQSLEQLRRPPCIEGHFDLNLSFNQEVSLGRPWHQKGVPFRICDHSRFDSVMGDFFIDGQKKLYREFVVYDKQAYPEFCVVYERTA